MTSFISFQRPLSIGLAAITLASALIGGTPSVIAVQAESTPAPTVAPAANQNQVYRSDTYGISFQYPAGWILTDQPTVRTLTLSSAIDAQAMQAGKPPVSIVISLAFASFREVNASSVSDFGPRLLKLAGIISTQQASQAQQSGRAVLNTVQIASAAGMSLDVFDPNSGVAGQTDMLSLGLRRVAIIRGVATPDVWRNQGGLNLFTAILKTVAFFPPPTALIGDQLGQVIWQTVDPRFKGFADLDVQTGGSTLLASDPVQGLWLLDANGNVTAQNTFPEIGAYGALLIYQDGTRFVADPVNHTIWLIPAGGSPKKFISGKVGTDRGQFGANSPSSFALGYQLTFTVLDTNDQGSRLMVYDRAGGLVSSFPLDTAVQNGTINSDPINRMYVVGSNLAGVWQISGNGQTIAKDIGKDVLAGSAATATVVDRFGNLYVATSDEGIVKFNLNNNFKFEGVIGQPYDNAALPKPGQLGHPTALTLSNDQKTLYVGDSGKYPQIVAFSLENTPALDLTTGTQDMGAIAYGQTLPGTISATKFVDTFIFSGQKGDVVTITMQAIPAAGSFNTLDPYLELLGQDGSVLAADDDAPASATLGSKDAQIATFTLPANARYTIRATRFGRESGTSLGAFTLALSK